MPSEATVSEHDWQPTTATHAVFKCRKCGAVGFAPHPLPRADQASHMAASAIETREWETTPGMPDPSEVSS